MIEIQSLAHSLEQQIRDAVDRNMQTYVEKEIQQLALDPDWMEKMQAIVNQSFLRRFQERLSLIDINDLVRKELDLALDRFRARLAGDFQTIGITDAATSKQVVIEDDVTTVNNSLAVKDLAVAIDGSVGGTLTVNNLCVRGSVNTDNRSWREIEESAADRAMARITEHWRSQIVADVVKLIQSADEFEFRQINVNGRPVFTDSGLSSHIRESSLETLGNLRTLTVIGHAELNDTMTVNRRRVGINTREPEMALSIWDEEVSMVAGKISQNTGFIGTNRRSALAIGTNRIPHIEINEEGVTTVKQLKIGRFRVAHEDQVPGYQGTRGDIVFNSDPKPNSPFAWVCLGAFKWQPIKSA
jgi:hypothetical protein